MPDANTAFLDSAGLDYILSSPSGAGGASEEIYQWLDISNDVSFPSDVRNALTFSLEAQFNAYGVRGDKKGIHVVGPNFKEFPCSQSRRGGGATRHSV